MAGNETHYTLDLPKFDQSVRLLIVVAPYYRDVADMLDAALDLFEEDAEAGPGVLQMARPLRVSETGHSETAARPWLRTRRSTLRQDSSRIAVFLLVVAAFTVGLVRLGQGDARRSQLLAFELPESCLRNAGRDQADSSDPLAAGTLIAGCVACHLDQQMAESMQAVQRGHAVRFVQNCVECHFNIAHDAALVTSVAGSSHTPAGVCLF